jgi:predicted Zn-dependent peptidase
MKFRIMFFALAFCCVQAAPAQLDRSKRPQPGPAPASAFPDVKVETTANGMRVIIVRNDELPTISMRLLIDSKPALEGQAAGLIGIAGGLLRNGTTTRTKDQLDEEVDRIGASLGSGGTSVFASGLTKYTEKLFELMSDITLHPSFPQEEIDKILQQVKSGLQHRKMEPNAIVEVVRKKMLYGTNHPYGEVETEESVGKITRAACRTFYTTYFKPNYAILAVVGDVDRAQVMKLVARYFGKWKKGAIPQPTYPAPNALDAVKVALVDRPASVQSVIRVGQTVQLSRTSPDVVPVEVMNTILGGGIFRLFMNLREKHAYTYGAYSNMGPDELIGTFTASTSVANKYTDSAITEIFNELKRIRTEKVGADELQMAKNYLSGAFGRSLETGDAVASRAIDIERYKLPKDYYKTYLRRLEGVTADDVLRVAEKYLRPDRMLVDVVGNGTEVKEKLATFGPVTMLDEEGNPVVLKKVALTITSEEIFAKHLEKIGGKTKIAALKDRTIEYTGKIQTMDMKVKNVTKFPGKAYQEIAMMGMVQRMGFDGEKGWASSPQGIVEITGEQLEALKTEGTKDYDGYMELGYTAAVTGTKTINGKECFEITLTKSGAPALKHYLGMEDYLLHRQAVTMTTPRGPMEESTDYLEYKDVSGYLIPSRLEQSVMGQTISFTLDRADINSGVADTLFVKPAK